MSIAKDFLKIEKADNRGRSYFYAERLGKDSVAFVLWNSNTGKYGLINEYKPPIDKHLITAFGGSIDKRVTTLEEIVLQEVLEEAGFKVCYSDITYLSKIFVSTQMNQFCHLYLVDVSDAEFLGRQEEDEVVWKAERDIYSLSDWKSICIITLIKNGKK